ncbi:hypothetical protein [Rugosimonospora africana]|uniref:Lipoprotein n=1 Tax=Rugosimonospora africana TaxID=556532 RepID=A0A8J3QZ48_9ACTN|nr:hypothetical protein [Rugosimonospora africana]GIH19954.1 hypothetical protein Raf01_81260 [Rugosimonospora africana]
MRRSARPVGGAALAVAGAALTLITGCGTGDQRAGGPAGPGAPAAAPTVTPAPAASSADATTANTRQVCDAINLAVAQGATTFGADLGSMTGHLAGGNRSAADDARRSALRELTSLAGKVRAVATPALNPAVRAAAETTAGNLDRAAADPGLLGGVKTAIDVAPVLSRITSTANPLMAVCV